ncbi:MAG TPA: hypothetical protein VFW44_09450 [Bryobacteraceae bacterium]|nr:hypothetical protein [Bryobacteraceae bacterium]
MARQALVILAVVVAFGILVPLYKGIGLLDPRIIAAYGCLALLFVAPASAELAGAEGKAASTSAVLARIGIIVAWGWGITVLILATAIVTLNLMSRRGGFVTPPSGFMSAVLVFSLSASIAIAMLGAVLARRFSANQVKNLLRTAFLVILLALAFGSRVLPESVTLTVLDHFSTRRALTHLAWQSALVCAVMAALLLAILFKTRSMTPFAKIPMAENPHEGGG